VPEPGNTLLLNLCSSSTAKDWTVDGWAAVIRCAREELGRMVVAVHSGRGPDLQLLEEIRRKIPVLELACTLAELLDLLAGACCLVSPDTGTLHLAGVVGTPVVGIYGYTHPVQWGPYWSQEWTCYYPESTKKVGPGVVLAALRALAQAGYPRVGGEGAAICATPVP
jgi:ADP-heptose:LPS heptosyltransferase